MSVAGVDQMSVGAVTSSASRRRADPAERNAGDTGFGTWGSIAVAIAFVAALTGLFIRLWLIFHSPSTSDEAVAGLIAQSALHGHFNAFYGGQEYGGTAEPYLIALAFLIFGQTAVVAEIVVGVLSAFGALLVWRITLRLVPDRTVALLAGALAWAAPAVTVRDSVRVYGFRGVTIVCGLGGILLALRILDGHRGIFGFASLGLLAGIGWWSSPEIVYYAIPILVILVAAVFETTPPRALAWIRSLLAMLGAFLLAALPWIWANAVSGFASLQTVPPGTGPPPLAFGGRFLIFFRFVLPMVLGLRLQESGAWLLGSIHSLALGCFLAVMVVALILCAFHGLRSLAIAAGVVAFPVLYAISPATWSWGEGQYSIYFPPLAAIVLAIGVSEGARRLHRHSFAGLVMCAIVAVSLVLSVAGTREVINQGRVSFTSRWADPDSPTLVAIAKLEAAGVKTGYASYFVAYKLDFLSKGRLAVTTAGFQNDRSPTINAAVEHSRRPAWLFVGGRQVSVDGWQFSATTVGGPDGETEAMFVATLKHRHLPYRVVDAGILSAVIPATRVTPFEIKLPGVFLPD
jgi:hypothetical protein